jgi:cold shock CspA family protein
VKVGFRSDEGDGDMTQGTIKDYDVQERTGSLLLDDRTEVAIDRTSTEGSGLRYLRIGQRVSLDVAEEGGRNVARNLRILTFV